VALLSTTTLRTDYVRDVASTDSDTIAWLGRQLQRAEDLVARYLGFPATSGNTPTLASTSYTLRLHGSSADPSRLVLPVAPVASVGSVYQDTAKVFAAATAVS